MPKIVNKHRNFSYENDKKGKIGFNPLNYICSHHKFVYFPRDDCMHVCKVINRLQVRYR